MHIRFRRTFKILPGVHLNVSKHGISTTVGPRGMHLTFNRYGVRQDVGLPGTGLSEYGYLVHGGHAGSGEEQARRHVQAIHHGEGLGCVIPGLGCLAILLVAAVAVVFFAADPLKLHPVAAVSHAINPIIHSLTLWARKMHL